MHIKYMIQRYDDMKQRFNPPIYNMYPHVQLCIIFYNKGRYVPY